VLERWRKPVVPIAIEPAEQGIWLPDGRVHGEVQLTLSQDDVNRMRAGWVCAKCLEPFESAWPIRCPVCGAPVRNEQSAYFAREFGGEVGLGPSFTIADELEALDEHRRKEEERLAREERSR
jgi:hypothetical protein